MQDPVSISVNICNRCEGNLYIVVERPDGSRVARDCECRIERRAARILTRASITRRHENCSFESFSTDFPSATPSLKKALATSRRFVQAYPIETNGAGLLLTGNAGVGKTHLAVSILKTLILEKSVVGVFCEYRDLLKQIQNCYNPQVKMTELEILKPIFEAEVLVIDELGATRPSDWVWDTVAHILNNRYSDRRTTIITTNYPNAPEIEREAMRKLNDPQRAMREETLGDRIGERMRSRLQEMCVVVEMNGVDFRQTVNLARFG